MKETRSARRKKKRQMALSVFVIVCGLAVIALLLFLIFSKDKPIDEPSTPNFSGSQETEPPIETESQTPPEIIQQLTAADTVETKETTIGIDVSKHQGSIDWKKVSDAGIDFVMVRVGYRSQTDGTIAEDTNARYNMQEAAANGIKVGAYFFSTAVTEDEAREEADWTAEYIAKYPITYPVAYNCEGFDHPDNRQHGLTVTERTDCALAFLTEIYERGYTPMFYASKAELTEETLWETSRIEKSFKIWVAQYPDAPYPDTATSSYGRTHDMWQYTATGSIAGIGQPVDRNVAYFGYESVAAPKDNEKPDTAEADVEALMNFKEVNETVTAKNTTNLRDIPSQGNDSKVLAKLNNGETAARTGISDSGWSRIILNGNKYYAVSNYLTTDLSYHVEEPTQDDDGIETPFTDVSEQVTPKIEVNLRSIPSVTSADSVVVATVKNGEIFTRTGINEDYGWSRVEYNGQTLYCVSSYLTSAQ